LTKGVTPEGEERMEGLREEGGVWRREAVGEAKGQGRREEGEGKG